MSTYDIIPEYKFPTSIELWPIRNVSYSGAVVQAVRMDSMPLIEVGERGVKVGVWGFKVICVLSNGEGSWWTVQRRDDEKIGIEEIVL